MEIDILQSLITGIVTSIGLFLIAKKYGNKISKAIQNGLGFVTAWPFFSSIIYTAVLGIVTYISDPTETSALSNELISMIPDYIISSYIGALAGYIGWTIIQIVREVIDWAKSHT